MDIDIALTGILIRAATLLVIALVAFWLGTQWKRENPLKKEFRWGYFQSLLLCSAFLAAVVLVVVLILNFTSPIHPGIVDYLVPLALFSVGFIGSQMLKRKRWAWLIGVLVSGPCGTLILGSNLAGLAFWIINAIYLGRRWKEMSSASPFPRLFRADRPDLIGPVQFSLSVRPCRQEHNGRVSMKHGQKYQVLLGNRSKRRCDVKVTIDDKMIGGFRVLPGKTLIVRRPAHDDGCFTFFALESPEGKAVPLKLGPSLGIIEAVFMPEGGVVQEQDDIRPLNSVESESIEGTGDEDLTAWKPPILCAPSKSIGPEELIPGLVDPDLTGGTGLSGTSEQSFSQATAIEHVPESEFIHHSVQLVLERPGMSLAERVGGLLAFFKRALFNRDFANFVMICLALIGGLWFAGWAIATYREYTLWEQPRQAYYSHRDLFDRGWTDSMIRDLLKAPDTDATNPVHEGSPPMRLWEKERVNTVESSNAFAERQKEAAKRSSRVRQFLENRSSTKEISAALELPAEGRPEIIPVATEPTQNDEGPKMRRIPE